MALSTHVLDTTIGKPAEGIPVVLEKDARVIARATTDADGRVRGLVPPDAPLRPGTYRLIFSVEGYFSARGIRCFFPEISLQFVIESDAEHYHVPLLLSPFGYSTYRGS